MSQSTYEVISLHRIDSEDLHNVGVEIADSFNHVSPDEKTRLSGIPMFVGVQRLGAPYVVERMTGSSSEDVNKMWTGIDIDTSASTPKPLGCVSVSSGVSFELGPWTGRKNKPPFLEATVIDVCSFVGSDESVLRMLEKGLDVARSLHSGTAIVAAEKTARKDGMQKNKTSKNSLSYLNLIKRALSAEEPFYTGSMRRKSTSTRHLDFSGSVVGTQAMVLRDYIWVPVSSA